jgi:hypothetical protein
MAGVEAFLKGWVSRMLPQAETDNDPGIVRLSRYGEILTSGVLRKQHALVDEGSYFVANNGQTGLATSTTAAFTATSPFVIVANTDSPGNPNAKRLALDYVTLITTAAGGAGSTGAQTCLAVVIDQGNRYSSAGTDLSSLIVSPNMDVGARASIAKVYAGALVATTATASARTLVGQRTARFWVSATVQGVVGDTLALNFGGVEAPSLGPICSATTLNTLGHTVSLALPAVVIGPGQSALIYVFWPAATTPTATSYAPELGWWER